MTMRITLDMLEKIPSTDGQRDRFTEVFPPGTEVTRELCLAHVEEFDWDEVAKWLLSDVALCQHLTATNRAWFEYAHTCRVAERKFDHACETAWNARSIFRTWKFYRARDDARAELKRLKDVAWSEYLTTSAVAFAQAFDSQEGV